MARTFDKDQDGPPVKCDRCGTLALQGRKRPGEYCGLPLRSFLAGLKCQGFYREIRQYSDRTEELEAHERRPMKPVADGGKGNRKV